MSYKGSNLSVLAYANNFTLWYYKTEDTQKDILSENYFGESSCMVMEDDIMIISTFDNYPEHYVITSNNNGVVDVDFLYKKSGKDK